MRLFKTTILVFFACWSWTLAADRDPLRVVFLDPGFTRSPLQLKTRLDTYLTERLKKSGLAAPSSQPIDQIESLVEFVKARRPAVIITSGQVLKQRQLDKGYTPKLNLVCHQTRDYSLLLLAHKGAKPGNQPLMASSYGFEFLRDYFPQDTLTILSSSRMIKTKKDLDGLMALVNKQVDWAVISDYVFALLIETHPDFKEQLAIHKNSKKVSYPSLFIKENMFDLKDLDLLLAAFRDMDKDPAGRELLKLMGCDSWQ